MFTFALPIGQFIMAASKMRQNTNEEENREKTFSDSFLLSFLMDLPNLK